ncbi:MAG: magnesium chelatase ATPase subunit D, partial [Pseudomonadota bacterium]
MPARGTAALAPADVAPADENDDPARRAWADALLAATLLAVDPAGLKGAVVRSGAGPARDAWLDRFRAMAAADASFVDAPCAAPEDHLIGGLDLGATLHAGRPVAQAGLLQRADGGVLVLRMAERVAPGVAAAVASALDTGAVLVERHGLSERRPARFCLLALDEGAGPDEAAPPILKDRVAFAPALDGVSMRALTVADVDTAAVAAARARLDAVSVGEPVMEAMDDAARAFGVPGLRPLAFCVAAARAHAALHGRSEADAQDAAAACRLVLGPRATATPAPPDEAEAPPPDPPPPDPPPDQTDSGAQNDDEPLPEDLSLDRLIEIVAASVDATALARRG